MADVEISYKGNEIATMSATGVKTLLTGDTFCEDDIVVSYTKPSAPAPSLQSKTVSPSTSQQTVSPDSGYDGLSSVTVNAMPSGSASTPATSITANPTISVSASGLITASVSGSKSVTPSVSAGYVSSGTSGTVSVSGSNTQQLTTQSAQTITPTTTNQTIASGKYLTGVQTILGDANLLAENIKKDVVLFGITGTYEGGGGGGAMLVPLTLHPSGMMLVSSKTAQEIMNAYSAGQPIIFAYDDDKVYFSLIKIIKYNSGCKIFTAKADDTTTLVSQTVNTMSANPTFSYQSL